MPRLRCHGCGTEVDAIGEAGVAFRCPRAGEGDVDHVLHPASAGGDATPGTAERWATDVARAHPFVRYRRRLTLYAAARALGMTDAAFVTLVEDLDARVAEVDGRGFRVTPTRLESVLASGAGLPCGHLVVKVEAGNVSGSHKGRHVFGLALWLAIEDWARARGVLAPASGPRRRLAIASCGNAALAAAVVARAAGRDLDVYVPTWASPSVLGRLRALDAVVHCCERQPGVAGDPCYLAFREAIRQGALPFCCQGPDAGLTIEGGETLAWEMLDALDGQAPDAVFVQVGGGALASALARGFSRAARAGGASHEPRFHAVQTYGCAPLVAAYDALALRLLGDEDAALPPIETLAPASAAIRADRAARLARRRADVTIDAALRAAATHRSAFMRPWEGEPHSLATGILDDETYDWLAIAAAMLRTGGHPVLASEDSLALANRLVRDVADVDACVTGTAGLAGLIDAVPIDPRLARERVAVVVSGARR